MDINQIISLGIGTPGAIKEFLTLGLQFWRLTTPTPAARTFTPAAESRTFTVTGG